MLAQSRRCVQCFSSVLSKRRVGVPCRVNGAATRQVARAVTRHSPCTCPHARCMAGQPLAYGDHHVTESAFPAPPRWRDGKTRHGVVKPALASGLMSLGRRFSCLEEDKLLAHQYRCKIMLMLYHHSRIAISAIRLSFALQLPTRGTEVGERIHIYRRQSCDCVPLGHTLATYCWLEFAW